MISLLHTQTSPTTTAAMTAATRGLEVNGSSVLRPLPQDLPSPPLMAARSCYTPETGVYASKHPPLRLPDRPLLDAVSFLFSCRHCGVTAVIDSASGHSISYAELEAMVRSMAAGLCRDIGLLRGQVVMVALHNSVYFPVICLAVMSVGAVVAAVNPLSSAGEVKKLAEDCEVKLVFATSKFVHKINGVKLVLVPDVIDSNLGSSPYPSFHGLLSFDARLAPAAMIRQDDTAAILYSSGTSGGSKGVVITHRNLIASVKLFIQFEASQYENHGWENVYLAAIPMFHVYGLSLFAIGLLSIGSTVVVVKGFNEVEVARVIGRYGVTHFPVVPPILSALVRMKREGRFDFGSLKQVSCGAAPLTEKTIRDFVESFPRVDFIQGYGMTETTAVGTRGFNIREVRKYKSVGLLAPNMEAKVIDVNTGSSLPPGKSGELWLRGPAIMKGYLNNSDATSETIDKDGWLHTGDIAYFDEDAYLYIVDRLKDVIKFKGFQVAPADLESILIAHPDILDVAVTAIVNEEAGEIPGAFVVKRPGSAISSEDIFAFVAQQVAPHKKVRQVVFIDSIPRSAAGKILRGQLRVQRFSRL